MWVDGALLVGTALLALPSLVLLTQIAVALRARAGLPGSAAPVSRRPSVAVLIPAHDEAAGIAATLVTVAPQLQAGDRLLVVADNCSDQTAAIARAGGAEVSVRDDLAHRGKGYALDHGLRTLAARPPEVVIVVDADCAVGAGCVDRIAQRCIETQRPVQALDLMLAPAGAGSKLRYAEFAWRVKNLVRPLGGARMGWPCQLMGTGMALRWQECEGLVLAHAGLAEDMQMGIDLALRGHPPLFEPSVQVSSDFPASDAAAQGQRRRWEQGHLAALLQGVPRLLAGAARRRDVGLVAMALDLCVPPLALLLLLTMVLVTLATAWWLAGGAAAPAAVAAVALALQGAAVSFAWWGFGRTLLRAGELAAAPLYALRKLPLYAQMAMRRQRTWVRTERDEP